MHLRSRNVSAVMAGKGKFVELLLYSKNFTHIMMMHNAHQYLTVCVPLFWKLFPLTAFVIQSVVSEWVSF